MIYAEDIVHGFRVVVARCIELVAGPLQSGSRKTKIGKS